MKGENRAAQNNPYIGDYFMPSTSPIAYLTVQKTQYHYFQPHHCQLVTGHDQFKQETTHGINSAATG